MNEKNVLDFWFGRKRPLAFRKWWFGKNSKKDAEIRRRFGPLLKKAKAGKLDEWSETPHGALALIIVLDQFSRNIHRDDARAFEADAKALRLAREGIRKGFDAKLKPLERSFFYMPFMHSEDRSVQKESLALFTKLGLKANVPFAKEHKRLIDVYGRFPHRNTILGRKSTKKELEYLARPGAGF